METKIAYCAGLVDGEGCIMIRRWKNNRRSIRYQLHLEVNQVRPEAIMLMRDVFKGRVYFTPRNGKYSGRWFWCADSNNVVIALQTMLPYLTIKKPEAELAIKFQSLKLDHSTSRSFKLGLTDEELAKREAIYLKLRALKHVHDDLEDTYIELARQIATDDKRVNSGKLLIQEDNPEPS